MPKNQQKIGRKWTIYAQNKRTIERACASKRTNERMKKADEYGKENEKCVHAWHSEREAQANRARTY